jgi:cellulose synthase/poly-beta-1,6-N-acetylglucosamine synthase-like glycosyltransferase
VAESFRSGGQHAQLAARLKALPRSEYAFLLGRFMDSATLARAEAIAAASGVHPHEVLIAHGWLDAADYYRALAENCGAPFKADLLAADVAPPATANPRQSLAVGLLKERARARSFVLAPDRVRPNALREMLARLAPHEFSLASPQAVRGAICRHFAPSFVLHAVEGLASRKPEQSARTPLALWQRLTFSLVPLVVLTALALWPATTVLGITASLGVLFVPLIGFRLLAAYGLFASASGGHEAACPRLPDRALPVYTLLVPLYREANMLPALARALSRLDYPAAKLDIKIILEASDRETIAAARALRLPGMFELVVVPELAPRTKPKALNYALPLARGDYIAIYDAEDRPEPGQLRQALNAFRAGPLNLAAVQARLGVYNRFDAFLTRQFAVEYCALFDGLLPALDRLALPLPLGGTSNHFRASALKWLMAWDPFNVTEDADLGIRLARNGYRCRMVASTTYEEAPSTYLSWLRQRTRWIKGYLQTWLVHMRDPRALWRELGPRGFIAFQIMIAGTVLSALVHPWFYALVTFDLVTRGLLALPQSPLGWPFWLIACFNLSVGYLASMALGLLALRRRGDARLLPQIFLMPIYWLLISAAAYRALWQFVTARFEWEKTEHGLANGGVPAPSERTRARGCAP